MHKLCSYNESAVSKTHLCGFTCSLSLALSDSTTIKFDCHDMCMHTNFGGYGYFGFGDNATFNNGRFSLSDHGHQKI